MLYVYIYIAVGDSIIKHSIQHYVIKFVSDLRKVGGFLRVKPRHTEILL